MLRAVRAAFRSALTLLVILSVVRRLILTAILAGFGVAVAGCGGSGAPGVANIGTTTASSSTTSVPSASSAAGSAVAASGSGAGAKIGAPFSVTGSAQQLTKFAACMRVNGEPTFPDPNALGVISASFNRASPQFSQALQSCRKELPGGIRSPAQQSQDLRQAVAFSACMRQNGVPDYPDPETAEGGGTVIHLANVDPNSPQFQRAQAICQKKFPGGGKG
jgi:hypothetical protein